MAVRATGQQQVTAAAGQAAQQVLGPLGDVAQLVGGHPCLGRQEARTRQARVQVAAVATGDRTRVAAVGNQQNAHTARALAEDRLDFIIQQGLGLGDVPGAQGFVAPVGFIAAEVRYPGAMAGIGKYHKATLAGLGDGLRHAGDHRQLGGGGIEQQVDGKTALA
ncbi:hypothetical protein D3C81_1235560 [compost metagenome]